MIIYNQVNLRLNLKLLLPQKYTLLIVLPFVSFVKEKYLSAVLGRVEAELKG
jgi:hypothetical protein